jgi:hypothetical protein
MVTAIEENRLDLPYEGAVEAMRLRLARSEVDARGWLTR